MTEELENGLAITGPMLIKNANALLGQGRGYLLSGKATGNVTFDLAGVEETDSSAISVLLSLARTAHEHDLRLRILHAPANMLSQAQMYGVSDILPFV